MRHLRAFVVRFIVVFIISLLVLSVSEYFGYHGHVMYVTKIDERYLGTLEKLKRPRNLLDLYKDNETRVGTLSPSGDPTLCLSLDPSTYNVVLAFCSVTHQEQQFSLFYSKSPQVKDYIKSVTLDKCIDAGVKKTELGTPLITYTCHGGTSQELTYDNTAQVIYHPEDNKCFDWTDVSESQEVRITPCDLKRKQLKWVLTRTDL